jgi:hypothetical protein
VLRVDELRVYENGIGALNLPYTEAQVGSHGTRAMHPRTLVLASELLSGILGHTLAVVNPSFGMTKAQLVCGLPACFHDLIPVTVSCDGFPVRRRDTPLCGVCTSCLLRRQALHACGLSGLEDTRRYAHDAVAMGSGGSTLPLGLLAMLDQAAGMGRALVESDPWIALIERFPPLARMESLLPGEPLLALTERLAILQLVRNYVSEWTSFPSPLVATYLGTAWRSST